MISAVASLYRPSYVPAIVYMLQSTEYQAGPYLRWYWRTTNFSKVMHRRELVRTRAAKLLMLALVAGIGLQMLAGLATILSWHFGRLDGGVQYGVALVLAAPVVWAHFVVVPLALGRMFIIKPRQRRLIKDSKAIFANHPGTIIAVAGSYGKTSMKELLLTVLSQGKTVAATPANKNVAVSHAYFAKKLTGKEDILIIEYGEGRPGDVARFANTTSPDIGVITGIAPAHLDHYKSLVQAARDIFSLADYLKNEQVFVNGESPAAQPYIKNEHIVYNVSGMGTWKVSNVRIGLDGTKFTLKKGKISYKLHSGLLGRHQVGPLVLAAILAHDLGLSKKQIEDGVAATKSYEHRMEPRIVHGAWLIDDTYNGNIEGVRVGLQLLQEVEGKRKIYVSPGLVDQGKETEVVHRQMGELIAAAKPDICVLMHNSVTKFILEGLSTGSYQGEIIIERDPLRFYTSLEAFVAVGDVMLMQNDWTDNYA